LIEASRARAAVVAGDQHDVSMSLGDACSDRADPNLGNKLDVDSGTTVRVLEIVDELSEVLDRVDVVMWWRRDETDPGRGVPGPGDPGVDLVPGQLAPLARFGSLRHLDLQIIGVDQVLTRHSEAPGRDLLDRAAPGVTVGTRDEPLGILTPFAGVGTPAESVHRYGERLVGLLRDRSI
jgi:hypothetical protein